MSGSSKNRTIVTRLALQLHSSAVVGLLNKSQMRKNSPALAPIRSLKTSSRHPRKWEPSSRQPRHKNRTLRLSSSILRMARTTSILMRVSSAKRRQIQSPRVVRQTFSSMVMGAPSSKLMLLSVKTKTTTETCLTTSSNRHHSVK